jgi:dihydrofolate reductase
MKVVLYMAITVNGMIASHDHNTPWTDDEWVAYSSKVKSIGNLIVGRTTYDFMENDNNFPDLGNPFVVVLTSRHIDNGKNVIAVKSFEEAISVLKDRGFAEALIGGGTQLDTAALESGLIDEIYLDVEPFVIGRGLPLFSPSNTNLELKFIKVSQIGKNSVQLHYKVKKQAS